MRNNRSGYETLPFEGTVELRATDDDDDKKPKVIAGYAARFNVLSVDLGGFKERIAPGAFSTAIGDDVRALFNHNQDYVIGRTKSRTLELSEDDKGLLYEVKLPDTSFARDLATQIERGDIDGSSFGFRTIEDNFDEVDGEIVRTLIKVELFDVSPVTFPAYPQADVAVRSFRNWQESQNTDQAKRDYEARNRLVRLAS